MTGLVELKVFRVRLEGVVDGRVIETLPGVETKTINDILILRFAPPFRRVVRGPRDAVRSDVIIGDRRIADIPRL